MLKRTKLWALVAAIAIGLTGCGGAPDADEGDGPLLVLMAASLSEALPEVVERFEEETGQEVTLVPGATGTLAAQIENGAPADVFFSADESTVARLADAGRIRRETMRPYAEGRLAIVWREGIEPPASLVALSEGPYEVISIANPEVAPYGLAAQQALEGAAVWESVEGVIVRGGNVADAYQYVRTGNADAGIVALSVVDTDSEPYLLVDPTLHEPIRQVAGVVEGSTNPAAERFLDFVTGAEGQEILGRHGFAAPR